MGIIRDGSKPQSLDLDFPNSAKDFGSGIPVRSFDWPYWGMGRKYLQLCKEGMDVTEMDDRWEPVPNNRGCHRKGITTCQPKT